MYDKILPSITTLILGNIFIIYFIACEYSAIISVLYSTVVMSWFFFYQRMASVIFAIPLFLAQFFIYFSHIPKKEDSIYYEDLLFAPGGYTALFHELAGSLGIAAASGKLTDIMRGFFLLFLYPLIDRQSSYENYMYLPANLVVISITTIIFLKLIDSFLANHHFPFAHPHQCHIVKSVSAFLLIISPTMVMHSNDILKDLPTLMLILLSTYFFLDKKRLLFLVFTFFAFLNRSYAPLIIGLYILAIKPPRRIDYLYISAFCIAMLMLVQFNLTAIGNMLLSMPYIYTNPLPIKASNWEFPLSMATIGGCIFSIGFIGAILMILLPKYRHHGLHMPAISIFLFGFLLIAVGYNNLVNFEGGEYILGTAGDNNFRKIIPILPLVILQFTMTIFCLRTK